MPPVLSSLRIRNLALVEDLLWEPGLGFIAITGETGAGKSVILGALNLLLGERADKGAIRSGADTCTVEAVFEGVEAGERLARLLEESGAEPCEEGRLLLKRTLSASGPGKQYANGSPCTLALMKSLGDLLVDLHGPHDHQSLFSRDQQTLLLDAFGACSDLRATYRDARKALLALLQEKDAITGGEQALLRELDLLEHQVTEISSANVSIEEESSLVARHKAAANAVRITECCAALAAKISGEDGSLSALATEAVKLTRELARLDSSAEAVALAAESTAESLSDLTATLHNYADHFDVDPEALAAIEARLDLIGTLKRKYGHTIEEVLAYAATAEARLLDLRTKLARADSLDSDIRSAEKRVGDLGAKLSAKRISSAKSLEKAVASALSELGFARCGFLINLDPLPEPGPLGLELAEFVFAPNPGEQPRPLRSIASSGEISRVMLALKGALAEQDEVPLLVFDEIDANVGGEIATKVAARMRLLAHGRQVLCITHLPQVAAAANEHYIVTKTTENGRTRTNLTLSQGPARTEEIARMLGGKSATALAHAKDLLHLNSPN